MLMTDVVVLLLFFLFMFAITIGFYLFTVYCLNRLGRKFGVGSFWGFAVPIYNMYLINQCARLPGSYLLINLIPFVGMFIWGTMVYGNIAKRLGKDYWLYGLGTVLVGIPFFIMAFDQSMPNDHDQGIQPSDFGQPHIAQVKPPMNTAFNQEPRYVGSTAFLIGSSGMYSGSVIPIPTEGVVVGRDPNVANIIISDSGVSKAHTRFAVHPQLVGTVLVEDLGSQNGTFYHDWSTGQWIPITGTMQFSATAPSKVRIGSTNEVYELKFEL